MPFIDLKYFPGLCQSPSSKQKEKYHEFRENTVKIQIWIAISVYVLVAIVKKTLNLKQSLYTILQILSVTLLEKEPIYQALSSVRCTNQQGNIGNQLDLFN